MKLYSTLLQEQSTPEVVLSLSSERIIYQASTIKRTRRLKACMKQVVGGVFCEIRDVVQEHEIIKALAEESEKCAYEPLKRQAYNEEKLNRATTRITDMLRMLLEERLTKYLEAIIGKLFDPTVELRWDIRNNHCQKFCEAILDYNVFGNFISTKPDCQCCLPHDPLYLVSFVCPSGSYDGLPTKVRPRSKKMAPNGLTEEYLFRFNKYGHHDESDIFDNLLEYWYDWGAFGGTIFKHQQLFPWDCTEACQAGRDNNEVDIKCNCCHIMKHVWAFPFDAWSLIQLHMFRERHFYTPQDEEAKAISDADWMRNRLDILDALQALNVVAAAMFKTKSFRESCRWVNPATKANEGGLKASRAEKKINQARFGRDRVKLAGIFRAQPESHFFEQDKYHDCTLAPWADFVQMDQIHLYIQLRDYRADQLSDVRDLYKKPSAPKAPKARPGPDPGNPANAPATLPMHENSPTTTQEDLSSAATARLMREKSLMMRYEDLSSVPTAWPMLEKSLMMTCEDLGSAPTAWNTQEKGPSMTDKYLTSNLLWLEERAIAIKALTHSALPSQDYEDSDSDGMEIYEDDDFDFNGINEAVVRACKCDINVIGKQMDSKQLGVNDIPEANIPEANIVAEDISGCSFCLAISFAWVKSILKFSWKSSRRHRQPKKEKQSAKKEKQSTKKEKQLTKTNPLPLQMRVERVNPPIPISNAELDFSLRFVPRQRPQLQLLLN
jgi:hypothetical protein